MNKVILNLVLSLILAAPAVSGAQIISAPNTSVAQASQAANGESEELSATGIPWERLVTKVKGKEYTRRFEGSGFFINPRVSFDEIAPHECGEGPKFFVTANHAIPKKKIGSTVPLLYVIHQFREVYELVVPAEVRYRDIVSDLAVLEVSDASWADMATKLVHPKTMVSSLPACVGLRAPEFEPGKNVRVWGYNHNSDTIGFTSTAMFHRTTSNRKGTPETGVAIDNKDSDLFGYDRTVKVAAFVDEGFSGGLATSGGYPRGVILQKIVAFEPVTLVAPMDEVREHLVEIMKHIASGQYTAEKMYGESRNGGPRNPDAPFLKRDRYRFSYNPEEESIFYDNVEFKEMTWRQSDEYRIKIPVGGEHAGSKKRVGGEVAMPQVDMPPVFSANRLLPRLIQLLQIKGSLVYIRGLRADSRYFNHKPYLVDKGMFILVERFAGKPVPNLTELMSVIQGLPRDRQINVEQALSVRSTQGVSDLRIVNSDEKSNLMELMRAVGDFKSQVESDKAIAENYRKEHSGKEPIEKNRKRGEVKFIENEAKIWPLDLLTAELQSVERLERLTGDIASRLMLVDTIDDAVEAQLQKPIRDLLLERRSNEKASAWSEYERPRKRNLQAAINLISERFKVHLPPEQPPKPAVDANGQTNKTVLPTNNQPVKSGVGQVPVHQAPPRTTPLRPIALPNSPAPAPAPTTNDDARDRLNRWRERSFDQEQPR